MNSSTKNTKTLILGVGNLLMGDEGVGIHLIGALENEQFPDDIELLDGGTSGLKLLSNLEEYDHIIMIDAALDSSPPGTIRIIKPKFSSDYPPSMSAHDLGLKDLIEGSLLLGRPLNITLLTVSIDEVKHMEVALSSEIRDIMPALINQISLIISKQ